MSNIKKIGVISLGCAKNRTDCEVMLAILEENGYTLCDSFEECDAIIVNTCAFIKEAKEEAIENILKAAEYKPKLKKLIVTGCLAQRYADEIKASIPEVDAVVGVKAFDEICKVIESKEGFLSLQKPLTDPHPEGKRILTTENYSVYLKIAEGCSNRCAYCAIPYIRGPFMPRKAENVIAEAEDLAKGGAVEINLIAQDLTRHPELLKIIKGITKIESVRWIRLLYLYPDEITDELIAEIANNQKIVKYIDIPLQHASTPVLRRMNRRGNQKSYTGLISKLRKEIPDLALRTTFIAGFPGETRTDFEELLSFIGKVRFDSLGAFAYSKEEGTPAASFVGQLEEKTKARRLEAIMTLQYPIVNENAAKRIGKTYTVLCEGEGDDGLYEGRTEFQAPEVDGKIFFSSDIPCEAGCFYNITVEKAECYDLYGRLSGGKE